MYRKQPSIPDKNSCFLGLFFPLWWMIFLIIKKIFYNNTFTQPGTEFSFTCNNNLDGMDTYLLLRNNKQSGPYSLQQLVSFGLKPYDLVWVEGKSAAWRYPSEVNGLKEYASSTEEQPYDRFYKKQEEKPQEKQVSKPVRLQEESYSLPLENKTVTTTKKVFVAMPENHITKKQSQPVFIKAPVIIEEKPIVIEEKRIENKPVYIKDEPILKEPVLPKQEPIVKANPVSFKEEPTLNEKYSESLDDIKKRYTETYLSRKKKSKWTSTHTSILQVFGGAIFFCFLVVVVYKNFAGEDKPPSRTTIIQPDKRSINTGTVTNTSTTIPPVTTEANKQHPAKKTQAVKEEVNPPDENLAIHTIQQKNDEPVRENEIAAVEKKAVMSKVTGDPRAEEVKPKTHPVNINRLVSVKANNYKQRAFGGVLNLELTVNNDSKFELDKVIVELQYLKPSEQPIKTETIVFSAIGPNGSKTLRIPDYLRGVKVAYKVMGIESSQYEKYTTAGL
jgi:hypothetical protein